MHSSVLSWITSRVVLPKNAHIFDLDCHGGIDLAAIQSEYRKQGVDTITYGVSDTLENGNIARHRVNNILLGGYLSVKVSHQSFSMAYSCPKPSAPIEERDSLAYLLSTREKDILQRLTSYLEVEGVLVYRIEEEKFNDIVNVLVFRYKDIEIAKIPNFSVEDKNEIIIIAKKRDARKEVIDRTEVTEIRRELISKLESKNLPLVLAERPCYIAPKSTGASLFRSKIIDPVALKERMNSSHLWGVFDEWIKADEQSEHHPPLPLHLGHMGILLSTGLLDGEIDGHLMKGRVLNQTKTNSEEGAKVTIERKKNVYSVQARVLMRDGAYIDLQ